MAFQDWKSDNYKFVGQSFNYAYANRMNRLSPIVGEVNARSVDYELTGSGGYGELARYDGRNLTEGKLLRGFKTIITPEEYEKSATVGFKEAKIDKMGECQKIGTKLGDSAAMTVYAHVLRMFANAWNAANKGGDGKSWAATDHPVAAMSSNGRAFVADPDAGTFSNAITTTLSVDAICDAQAKANSFVTPDGLPFLCEMDTLLVGPDQEAMAKKICGTTGALTPKYEPEADNHSANPVYGLQYIVVGGGADGFKNGQWAICDRRLMNELVKIVYNTRPMVKQTALDNPWLDTYSAYVDFGTGWGDARQIIFSDPN